MPRSRICQTLARFGEDRGGAVAVIFALSIFMLGGVVALAVDASRAYSLSQHVAAVLDSAGMAAAKALDTEDVTDADLQKRAQAYFDSNTLDLSVPNVTFSEFRVTPDRDKATVKAEVRVHMPTSFAQVIGIPTVDFEKSTLVEYRSKRIELAMVLDVTGSMCMPSCAKLDGLKAAANDVIDALATVADAPGNIRIAVAPYSASLNAGGFASAVTNGGSGDTCVVERSGGDNAIESAPGAGSWLGKSSTSANPQYSCPPSPVTPLTDISQSSSRSTLKSHVNSLSALGGTAGHIGLAWGWYMVSPQWTSIWPGESDPKPYDPERVIKAVILMTDGEFNTSYLASGMNSTDRGVPDSSPAQAIALCNAMKDKKIRIYSVAFQSTGSAETLLRDCASSSENFYTAENASELKSAFRSIADKLTMMRFKQ